MIDGEYALLDLCCCGGGAAKGYFNAGFVHILGIDNEKKFRKHYPYDFYCADAIQFLWSLIKTGKIEQFDAIHGSPPCQHATIATSMRDRSKYPRLIEPMREAMIASGKPYVIENVKGAALHNPITLCGSMFDLEAIDDDGELVRMERHRLFESNIKLVPPCADYHDPDIWVAGSYGGARRDKYEAKYIRRGGYVPSMRVQQELLGIDWMTQYEMFQSLPPAYTEYIGALLIMHLEKENVA